MSRTSLPKALFFLRITIFLVMFLWTLDKFIRPEHASSVFENFYKISGLGSFGMYLIGGIELLAIVGFVAGWMKKWTYGFVLVLHGVSTLSSYKQYLSPFEGGNLLFFAAWPMLAGCFILFLLRDEDTFLAVN